MVRLFTFSYRYQRADLSVDGPLPYPVLPDEIGARVYQLAYSCSGMAAISGLLQAIGRGRNCTLFLGAGSYKETLELVARSSPQVRILDSTGRCEAGTSDGRVLWLDSSSLGNDLEAGAELRGGAF